MDSEDFGSQVSPRSMLRRSGVAYPKGAYAEHMKEGGMTIKIKHPGAMHEKTGTPKGEKIPVAKLEAAKNSENPQTRKQANFALNARKWNKK